VTSIDRTANPRFRQAVSSRELHESRPPVATPCPPPPTASEPSTASPSTAAAGQPYEAFLLTSNVAVDTFTITKDGLPPGLSMPATYGPDGTTVGGTPTKQGTSTFTVHVTPFGASTPATNGTYSITRFTIRVTDSAGDQAAEPGSITIAP
jgi:hypothetical protein